MIKNLTIFLFAITIVACSKKSDEIQISPDNLTICPDNTICSYTFLNSSGLINPELPLSAFQVFSFSQISGTQCTKEIKIGIKESKDKQSFKYNDYDTSKCIVYYNCSCCDAIPMSAVKWSVKGVKIETKNNEKAKWLIEAQIVLAQASIQVQKTDTVSFKQYFYQE